MFELLAAIVQNNQIKIYTIKQFSMMEDCIKEAVIAAASIQDATVAFICAGAY